MNEPLNKLISAARKACGNAPPCGEVESCCEVPLGFGTRVARAWGKSQNDMSILFERWAWRGLAFALAICTFTAIARETIASSQHSPYAEVLAAPGEELF